MADSNTKEINVVGLNILNDTLGERGNQKGDSARDPMTYLFADQVEAMRTRQAEKRAELDDLKMEAEKAKLARAITADQAAMDQAAAPNQDLLGQSMNGLIGLFAQTYNSAVQGNNQMTQLLLQQINNQWALVQQQIADKNKAEPRPQIDPAAQMLATLDMLLGAKERLSKFTEQPATSQPALAISSNLDAQIKLTQIQMQHDMDMKKIDMEMKKWERQDSFEHEKWHMENQVKQAAVTQIKSVAEIAARALRDMPPGTLGGAGAPQSTPSQPSPPGPVAAEATSEELYESNCPNCNAALQFPATMSQVSCPQCQSVFQIRQPEASQPEVSGVYVPRNPNRSDFVI